MSEFAATLVTLPNELKLAIAAGVLALARVLLAGRVPDAFVSEIAIAVTTALITGIELALGLIPLEFEALAAQILQLIVILLGMVLAANGYRLARTSLHDRGLRA